MILLFRYHKLKEENKVLKIRSKSIGGNIQLTDFIQALNEERLIFKDEMQKYLDSEFIKHNLKIKDRDHLLKRDKITSLNGFKREHLRFYQIIISNLKTINNLECNKIAINKENSNLSSKISDLTVELSEGEKLISRINQEIHLLKEEHRRILVGNEEFQGYIILMLGILLSWTCLINYQIK